jgi:4-carboxymuconolactone decarboxylase
MRGETVTARVPDAEPSGENMNANIFRALANAPQVLRGFGDLGGRLLFRGLLSARTRELVILRMGALLACDYEWGQHVPRGRETGLSDDEIRGVRDGSTDLLTPSEAAAVRFCQAVEESLVDDAVWDETAQHFSAAQMVELTVLAGYYGLVCRSLLALRVPLDAGIAGLGEP